MPGPRLAFALASLTLVGGTFPFVGLFGVPLAVVAWRGSSSSRLRHPTLLLCAASVLLGLSWVVVFFEPARPVALAQSPRVSTFDGAAWEVSGAFVSGSLYPWAERRDVAAAERLRPVQGQYGLRVDGARDETYLVDSVGLLLIDHAPGESVVATTDDRLVAPRNAQQASVAPAVDTWLRGEPVRRWTFDLRTPPETHPLLLLTARTTRFAEDAFARYLATMGQGMDPFMSWVTKETCSDACRQEVWDDETDRLGIPLRITVNGEQVISIAPVGELSRTFAVPLTLQGDLSRVVVQVDATPGFWELTGAALAPSFETLPAQVLAPTSAMLTRERVASDVLGLVITSDRRRAVVGRGERLDVTFEAPPPGAGAERSAFIALRAHYRVPTGGRRFINPAAIALHRMGVTSLPRFAATLSAPTTQ